MVLLRSEPGPAEPRSPLHPSRLCSECRTSRQHILKKRVFGWHFRIQVSGGFCRLLRALQASQSLPHPGDSKAQPTPGGPSSQAAPPRGMEPQASSHKGQGLECEHWVSVLSWARPFTSRVSLSAPRDGEEWHPLGQRWGRGAAEPVEMQGEPQRQVSTEQVLK